MRDDSLSGGNIANLSGIELNDGSISGPKLQQEAIGPRELADIGGVAGQYGDAMNVAQFTVAGDGRVGAATNVPISVGLSRVYIKEFSSVGEGTLVCCDDPAHILLDGAWSSPVGHKNGWYLRDGKHCMHPYEGQSRRESGNMQILCAVPTGDIPLNSAPTFAPPSDTAEALQGTITVKHVTSGTTCPPGTGVPIMRKWVARTCSDATSSCTTPSGWGWAFSPPTCNYDSGACTADSFDESICMGN